MNTLSYLSTIFSPRKPVASGSKTPPTESVHDSGTPTTPPLDASSAEPTQDLSDDDSTGTVYISARRNSRPGERPRISLSLTTPPHLISALRRMNGEPGSTQLPPSYDALDVELPESPVTKEDEDFLKEVQGHHDDHSKGSEADSVESEQIDGEKKLRLKEAERMALLEASWPVKFSVRLFLVFRQFLTFIGWNHYRRSTPPLLTANSASTSTIPTSDTPTSDEKEILSQQQKLFPPPPPQPRTASPFFLLRTPSPFSRSSSPSSTAPLPSPLPRPPPRLTPKTLVLDLDETLIHSTSRPYNPSRSGAGLKMKVVEVVLDGKSTVYTVYKRPWVDFFLRKVSLFSRD
jgi:hypothetical protein